MLRTSITRSNPPLAAPSVKLLTQAATDRLKQIERTHWTDTDLDEVRTMLDEADALLGR